MFDFWIYMAWSLVKDQIYDVPFADEISYEKYFKLSLSIGTGWSKYQHSLERKMKLFRFYCIMSMDSLFVEQLMHLGLVDSLNW